MAFDLAHDATVVILLVHEVGSQRGAEESTTLVGAAWCAEMATANEYCRQTLVPKWLRHRRHFSFNHVNLPAVLSRSHVHVSYANSLFAQSRMEAIFAQPAKHNYPTMTRSVM